MTRFLLGFVAALITTTSFAAESMTNLAAGDADAGRTKAAVCSACHGADGNSISGEWPSLAGQHASYTVNRLKAFKSGEQQNAIMAPMVMNLSEQDMNDLAAYYESLTVKPGEADPVLVEAGSEIYRLGNEKSEIASCAACHGPRGHGNPVANMPAIAGQRATYVISQLNNFANGTRNGGVNNMMADIAKTMSADEMAAVAAFIEGLH